MSSKPSASAKDLGQRNSVCLTKSRSKRTLPSSIFGQRHYRGPFSVRTAKYFKSLPHREVRSRTRSMSVGPSHGRPSIVSQHTQTTKPRTHTQIRSKSVASFECKCHSSSTLLICFLPLLLMLPFRDGYFKVAHGFMKYEEAASWTKSMCCTFRQRTLPEHDFE
eukprot:6197013-Pleurochrysis_carterae.AAC.3